MLIFAGTPSTVGSTMPVEFPKKFMVGQQRQKMSELQFGKFQNLGSNVLDQRSGDG